MVNTIDEIGDGRLILGVGAGDSVTEHANFGYHPTDRLVSRFEEAMQVIVPLVREGRLDRFHGKYYNMHDITLAPRGPSWSGVPILIGAQGGPHMMRLMARIANFWTAALPTTGDTFAGFGSLAACVEIVCEDVGRDPSTRCKMAEAVV